MAQVSKRQLKTENTQPKRKLKEPKVKKPRGVYKPFKMLKFLIPPYFRNSWRELRQVKWPGRKETWQLTFAVFAFAIVFGLIITLTDYGLDKVFKKILLK